MFIRSFGQETAFLKMKKMHDEEYVVKRIETGPFRMIDKSTGLEKTIERILK